MRFYFTLSNGHVILPIVEISISVDVLLWIKGHSPHLYGGAKELALSKTELDWCPTEVMLNVLAGMFFGVLDPLLRFHTIVLL